ncbi:MAG: flagellar basal body rod protein FlgB [Alphaproteobacteria bacterium]|nr:flagellar basal body rod protein FlgB [Alphaproteobacteria bacterium]
MALGTLFSLISEKMDYLTQRQGVIAQNIAQANTPNYKPKDIIGFDEVLKKVHFGNSATGSSNFHLATTNPNHVTGVVSGSNNSTFKTQKINDLYEVKPSGNAVVLEQQMSKLSDTTGQYMMMTTLYKKTLGLLKTALGRGTA